MAGRPSWRSWPAASARTPPRGSFAGIMRPNSTSCGTSSRRKSRPPGRGGWGTRVSHPKANTGRCFHPGKKRRYVYRKAVSSSETVRSLSDQTHVSCPVCGHYTPADATVCGACAFVLSNLSPEEKVDAILEDLLDLSKAPMAEAKPAPPPAPEEPEVDEIAAEELFDSLLVEIQPSPSEGATEARSVPHTLDDTPPPPELPLAADRSPALAP